MSRGGQCGRPDGHPGKHLSVACMERERERKHGERERERKRLRNAAERLTPHPCAVGGCTLPAHQCAGGKYHPYCYAHKYLLNRKQKRKAQAARFGALIGIPDLTVEEAARMVMDDGYAS